MKFSLTWAICLLATTGFCAAEWTPFSSQRAGFKASFPTAPQESVQSIETALGPIPYTTYMSEIENGSVAFGVAYNDYPEEVLGADPEKILDGGRDGARDNLGGTIVSEISLSYRGHPGREFTILSEVQGQRLMYHTRLFLIGTRLYQMQIVRVGETPVDLADAIRFFSSFESLGTSEQYPARTATGAAFRSSSLLR
ncbi:MAG: hypothetical protein KDA75_14800 [Planctomycetaceae bacterium]|nr:hypothetical protein [Planctomycetaceae bacterium]